MSRHNKAPAKNTQPDHEPSTSGKGHSMFTRQAALKKIQLAERSAPRRWFDDANANPNPTSGPSSYGFNT